MMTQNLQTVTKRLRDLVIQAYTSHTVSRGGIVKRKTAKEVQIENTVARELVAFAVDYDIVPGHRTPEGLWWALVEEAIEHRDLVRDANTGLLQHRLDYQLHGAR